MLPIARIILNGFFLANHETLDLNKEACDFQVILQFLVEEVYIDFALLYDTILLSPSQKTTFIVYIPVWLITHLIHGYRRFNLGDPTQLTLKISLMVLMFSLSYIIYYMIQIQELERFFEHEIVIKNKHQVSKVLDAQSDAILVVDTKQKKEENEATTSGDQFEILFCNSKSVEFFGVDLK